MDEEKFLTTYNIKDYERPSVAADIAVFAVDEEKSASPRKSSLKKLKLMLIRRGVHPFSGMWALPGGFLKMNETIEQCAQRELSEETGLDNFFLEQFRTYSEVNRDPRGRIISCAYTCFLPHTSPICSQASDAAEARWFDCSIIRKGESMSVTLSEADHQIEFEFICSGSGAVITSNSGQLAFDHMQIIADAVNSLIMRIDITDRIFYLMPEVFSIPYIQSVYSLICGHEVSKEVIHRLYDRMIEKTQMNQETGQHKRAALYRKKSEKKY